MPHQFSTTLPRQDSPIGRTPIELLSRIFKECLPADPVVSIHKEPLKLCYICREWRHIARSTPPLWASVKLDVIQSKPHQNLVFFTQWLELGGNLPLTITIEYPDIYGSKRVLESVIDTVLKHVSRWKVLRVVLPFNYTEILLNGIHGPTNLQELRLSLDGSPEELLTVDLEHFQRVSRLELNVTDLDMVWNKQFSTCLSYADLGPHERMDSCLELIKRSPLLEELSVIFYSPF